RPEVVARPRAVVVLPAVLAVGEGPRGGPVLPVAAVLLLAVRAARLRVGLVEEIQAVRPPRLLRPVLPRKHQDPVAAVAPRRVQLALGRLRPDLVTVVEPQRLLVVVRAARPARQKALVVALGTVPRPLNKPAALPLAGRRA